MNGRALLLIGLSASGILAGCGERATAPPTPDPAPFREAVSRYLDRRRMGMEIKQVQEGPTVSGDSATMTASMVAAGLGGPAVRWRFHFQRDPDGRWEVTGHEPQ